MTRRVQENMAAGVMLVLFIGVIILCQDFGPRARMIPLPLAVAGLVLTLVQIVWQNLRSTEELQMDLISVAGRAAAQETASTDRVGGRREEPSWRSEARAFGMVCGLLVLVLLVGPMPAVFLFTGGYFTATRHYSWRAGLIYTVIFTVTVYLLFFVALQIQPYHGLLAPVVAAFE